MKKIMTVAFVLGFVFISGASFAETAYEQAVQTSADSSTFDGGTGSTLDSGHNDNDASMDGGYQGQGTTHVEANS